MNKTNASSWLRGYMELEKVNLEEISEEFHIPMERLVINSKEPFWADEFLSLCAYFDVDIDHVIERNLDYYSEDDEFYEFEGYGKKSDDEEM